MTVTNEIDAKVTLGGITLFRYRHDSREIWKDGKVVSLNAVTDDDGTLTRIDATLTTAGLLIEGSAGRFVAPSDTAPMSLWRKDVLGRQHLLDMTTGAVVSVQPTRIAATGIDAERWRLGGDLDLELVYGADGLLLATRFKARGSMFEYRPIEESASLMMRP